MTIVTALKSITAMPANSAAAGQCPGANFSEALGLAVPADCKLVFSRLPDAPFGVEIRGVEWVRPDEEAARLIHIAFRRHLLLVLRGQPSPTEAQLDAFFRGLGRLVLDTEDGKGHYSVHLGHGPASEEKKKMKDFLSRSADNTGSTYYKPGADGIGELSWHNDQSHKPMLKLISVFEALDVESGVVPTEFCDLYTAYEMLSPALRAEFEYKNLIYFDPRLPSTQEMPRMCDSMHPVFQPHPHTGRRALWASDAADRIAGIDRADSNMLLKRLRDHVAASAPKYRHQWQTGDMVIWDNIGLQHRRGAIPPNQKRNMRQYGGLAE
jgi:taurine dioxygenase